MNMSCQCTCNIASQEYELDNIWFWIILLFLSCLSLMQIIRYITENDLSEIYTVDEKVGLHDLACTLTSKDMIMIRKDVIGYFENGFFKPPRTPFEILLQTFYMAIHVLLKMQCEYLQYPICPLFHKGIGSGLAIDYVASGDQKPYYICGMPEIFLRMYYRSVYTLFQIYIEVGQKRCRESTNRNKEHNILRIQSALFRPSLEKKVKTLTWKKIEEECIDRSGRNEEGLLALLGEEHHRPGVWVRVQGIIRRELETTNCSKSCRQIDEKLPANMVCRMRYLRFQCYTPAMLCTSNKLRRERQT